MAKAGIFPAFVVSLLVNLIMLQKIKLSFILFSFVFTSITVNAQSKATSLPNADAKSKNNNVEKIDWIDIETAQERLKKEPRKLLVDVYTSWCGWCKKMDATTFSHPDVVAYVNEHYYAVKLNAESKKDIDFNGVTYVNPNPEKKRPTHQLASLAAVNGRLSYPTVVYLDEDLNLLSQVPGFFNPKGIEPIIHYFAEEAYKSTSWEEYQQNFKGSIQ